MIKNNGLVGIVDKLPFSHLNMMLFLFFVQKTGASIESPGLILFFLGRPLSQYLAFLFFHQFPYMVFWCPAVEPIISFRIIA